MSRAVDPTEWANRRKASMERAKQLREERAAMSSQQHTFQPTINKKSSQILAAANRPPAPAPVDTLDELMNPMEQMLPAQRARLQAEAAAAAGNGRFSPPRGGQGEFPSSGTFSPGSDALGREVKRFGGAPPAATTRNAVQNDPPVQKTTTSRRTGATRQPWSNDFTTDNPDGTIGSARSTAEESDSNFLGQLRSDKPTSSRGSRAMPAWNDDTTPSTTLTGTFAPAPTSKTNPRVRPAAGATNLGNTSATPRAEWNSTLSPRSVTSNNRPLSGNQPSSTAQPVPTSAGSMSGIPRRQSNDALVSQARSSLSLLKSKIRQIEGSNGSLGRRTESSESFGYNAASSSYSQQRQLRSTSSGAATGAGMEWAEPAGDDDVMVVVPRASRAAPPAAAPNARSRQQPPVEPPVTKDTRRHGGADPFGGADGMDPYGDFSSGGAQNPFGSMATDAESGYDEPKHQCPDCGRSFNQVAIEKHIKICKKVFVNKRKQFNSKAMRIGDNEELVKMQKKAAMEERRAAKQAKIAPSHKDTPVGGGGGDSKWKSQSEAFREAMRAARQVSKSIAEGKPLPPPVISAPDPSLIQCPHCPMRLNERAAERHIPLCQNIKNKPKRLMRNTGRGAAGGAVKR